MQIYTLDLNVKERSFQISRHRKVCRKVISTERVDLGTSLYVWGDEPCLFNNNTNSIQAYLVLHQF